MAAIGNIDGHSRPLGRPLLLSPEGARERFAGSKLVVLDRADHALLWARTADFERVVDRFLKT